jgi:hypothetical protein
VTDEEPGPAFGVEAATVEEFLRLLKEREEGEAPLRGPRGATRRAVFVAQLLDGRGLDAEGRPGFFVGHKPSFTAGLNGVARRRSISSARRRWRSRLRPGRRLGLAVMRY